MTNIFGTNLNEQLIGTALADVIKGLFGDDTISAGDGNDKVEVNEVGLRDRASQPTNLT